MKEWLSKPQNISPLFPLPYIHLLSEVLPVHWGNAGWWLQSLKVWTPNCGIQRTGASIGTSLQPQPLLSGKENKQKKTWELW